MSLSSYSDLQDAIANWVHRTDLGTIIPDLILVAEKRIFRELRVREMETALSGTISSGVLAVPSNYLELKSAYISATPSSVLQRATVTQIYTSYPLRASASRPKYIAREGSNFIFGPYPDADYTIGGIYYAEPTSIQTSANAVFTEYPDLYLFASLSETARYLNDSDRMTAWEASYQAAFAMAMKQTNEYGSGGGLEVTVA